MKYLFAGITVLLLLSCSLNSNFKEDSSWLEGSWERKYNGIKQMEIWTKTDSGFTGQNLFISGDTNLMNTYQITHTDDKWTLTKSVIETDISFSYYLLKSNSDSMVFKNSQNIWPQTVTYKKLEMNKMDYIVSGQDGTMQKNAGLTFIREQ